MTYNPENWPGSPVSMNASTDNVNGHQVVTLRTEVPDDMRVTRVGARPVSDEEFVVELRLRRISSDDPRTGIIPSTMLDNFITG